MTVTAAMAINMSCMPVKSETVPSVIMIATAVCVHPVTTIGQVRSGSRAPDCCLGLLAKGQLVSKPACRGYNKGRSASCSIWPTLDSHESCGKAAAAAAVSHHSGAPSGP